MDLHVVEVEAAAGWDDDDRLIDLHQALGARPELLEASLAADRRGRAIGVTVTVEALDPATAHAIADNALSEELATLGFGRA